MAKRSAEKTIKSLLGKELIFVIKEKNRIRYTVRPSADPLDIDALKKSIRVWIAILTGNVVNLENFYKQEVLIQ